MFYVQNISRYKNFCGVRALPTAQGDAHGPLYILCLLFKKFEKYNLQEHDLYLNKFLHHFYLKNFSLGYRIEILGKGVPLLFLYEVSTVVLIDFCQETGVLLI